MPPKKNLKLLAMRLRRLSEFLRGEFLAAAGGEMRSDYFKYSALLRSIVEPRSVKHFNNK